MRGELDLDDLGTLQEEVFGDVSVKSELHLRVVQERRRSWLLGLHLEGCAEFRATYLSASFTIWYEL